MTLEVIPAIDLLGGQCVRLWQGDYQQASVVSQDPVEQARRWWQEGATRLHVVDLDGAKTGDPTNWPVIRAMVQALPISVQVGGGIRSVRSAEQWLDQGVERVIVGTMAVENPQELQQLCQRHPGQIVVGIDARQGKVATRGWLETTPLLATELAQQVSQMGSAAIIYTDIQRDGTLEGPNLEQLQAVLQVAGIPVIASGGIASLTDLLSLLRLVPQGLSGVIVGKALYSGAFSLTEALRAVSSGRWQDIPPDNQERLV
ncbi:MAG: 1-(5-phosphoribosyl)-5-[(5-phosphoribosylamino)methylideneamino]imidazole-4-carboxamide isomerase [Cyanobacteriota bacterium]|nr:1-(5-phosphoribosyl)-5-[(5-phosphoribosylamino)methylideneamino]imidazole-4-carboxamide isomerase [Cyanobacteriota bacterium]